MIKVGDTVVRMLAGVTEMKLIVTDIQGDVITCGWWTFDRHTGAEIDDDLDWGPPPKRTGSFIYIPKVEEDAL